MRPDWTWIAVIAALLIHVGIALLVNAAAINGDLGGFGQSRSTTTAAMVPPVPLKTGCISDGAFAAAGRGAMCFAPWIADTDDCLGDAQMSFWLDTSSCYAQKEKNVAEISMLDKKSAEKMTPIELWVSSSGFWINPTASSNWFSQPLWP